MSLLDKSVEQGKSEIAQLSEILNDICTTPEQKMAALLYFQSLKLIEMKSVICAILDRIEKK